MKLRYHAVRGLFWVYMRFFYPRCEWPDCNEHVASVDIRWCPEHHIEFKERIKEMAGSPE